MLRVAFLSVRRPAKQKTFPGLPVAHVETFACLLPLTLDAWAADHERRGSGRGIVAPGARAIARHVRGSATVCPGRRLLASASLPAVARERGKASPAGRRAWQARSSWPHHGRCKCA